MATGNEFLRSKIIKFFGECRQSTHYKLTWIPQWSPAPAPWTINLWLPRHLPSLSDTCSQRMYCSERGTGEALSLRLERAAQAERAETKSDDQKKDRRRSSPTRAHEDWTDLFSVHGNGVRVPQCRLHCWPEHAAGGPIGGMGYIRTVLWLVKREQAIAIYIGRLTL